MANEIETERTFEQWISWPEWAKDGVVSHAELRFSWRERLLILLGRPVTVSSKNWTEHRVGRTQGMLQWQVARFPWPWSRPSFGVAENTTPRTNR